MLRAVFLDLVRHCLSTVVNVRLSHLVRVQAILANLDRPENMLSLEKGSSEITEVYTILNLELLP